MEYQVTPHPVAYIQNYSSLFAFLVYILSCIFCLADQMILKISEIFHPIVGEFKEVNQTSNYPLTTSGKVWSGS